MASSSSKSGEIAGVSAVDDNLPFRVVRISFDSIAGEVVLQYGMPNGAPDVKRVRLGKFHEDARDIVRSIAFHVTP
jgi:hypothetical protein